MTLKLISDRAESWSQNLKLIFERFVVIKNSCFVYFVQIGISSFHSSYVVCFVMSLFKTLALPVCICKRRLARLRSLCTLILKPYELACSRSFPPPLPPFPLPSLPPNRLYLFWNVYLCMCFRLLVEHNCSHLIFLRTCLQSSDNVLIANC